MAQFLQDGAAPCAKTNRGAVVADIEVVPDGGLTAWTVVAALSLTGFMLYGGGLYAFIVLVNPVATEFHWGRADVGGLVSAFWLSAPLSLWAAPLVKRFGVRRMTVAGIAIEAVALICVVEANTLWEMYALRAVAGLGKVLFAVALPVTLGRWFSKRFGLALAIAFAGWSLGGLVMAPVTSELIDMIGWRETSIALGSAVLLVTALPAYWATGKSSRLNSELGLKPGDPDLGIVPVPPASVDKIKPSLRPPFENKSFRWIAASTLIYYITYSGLLAHQPGVVVASHISIRTASVALGTTAGFSAIGCIGLGWLIDRSSIDRFSFISIGLMLLGALSLLALTIWPSIPVLVIHIVCFGFAMGGSDVYWVTVVKRSVSKTTFPAAYGAWYFLSLLSAVIGPTLVGLLFDRMHSYSITIALEASLVLFPLVVMTTIGRARSFSAP